MKCCKISDDQGGPLLANIGENPRYEMAPQYRGTVPFCVHISCTNWQDNTDHVQELVVCMAWYNNKSLKYCTVLYREGGNNGEAQTSHSKWFLHGWYSLSLGGKVYLNLPPGPPPLLMYWLSQPTTAPIGACTAAGNRKCMLFPPSTFFEPVWCWNNFSQLIPKKGSPHPLSNKNKANTHIYRPVIKTLRWVF